MTLTISAPVRDSDGGGESNPIHLTLGTDRQDAEGSFLASSVQRFRTPDTGRELTLVYWQLSYDNNTGHVVGTLVDNHLREVAALNTLGVTKDLVDCRPELGSTPFVAAMDKGTKLQGQLSRNGGQIDLAGSSVDRLFDFRITAQLQPRA